MSVTPDDVRHVATLARLSIPEGELAPYVEQLNAILGHMEALQQVPSSGAAAADAVRPGMALRADVAGAVPLTRPPAEFAPEMREGFFLVPRLATHEDAGEGA
ncbi:MAG: Asp-tRNA(Asn)/Glu-tRNA(Gln) amidotransferase subunit GatC [Gemmatimonadetes bacterium]|nr:Asp-tRNA(Asn)/Glu-tRNA(Gln) amidotransferase subunit GatC [Gemmatimonadota bacterium]MBM4190709.1 Asp-tRNA(Asn)/Glu-tRNA(Gln) amidotransferase subunit GatC [Gemmatimonadota bacterium]